MPTGEVGARLRGGDFQMTKQCQSSKHRRITINSLAKCQHKTCKNNGGVVYITYTARGLRNVL